MQQPPYQRNPSPEPKRTSTTNVVLIILGVLGGCILLCCGGGAFLFWRSGISDIVGCSSLTTNGQYQRAIPPCRAVVAKLPQDGEGHNNLAWCLTIVGQMQEGLAESRRAVELSPNPSSYDTLAMALAVSGQGDEALKIETERVMVNGDVTNDFRRVTLGMVYYSVGRKQDAHSQWETARTSSNPVASNLAKQFEAKYP